jgi:hypothetical protein
VFDRCRVEEPPLFDVGGGQSAACWLVEGGRSLPALPVTEGVPAAIAGDEEPVPFDLPDPIAAAIDARLPGSGGAAAPDRSRDPP